VRNRIRVTFAALVLAATAASAATAGQYPQDHAGWSIGLGVGGSSAAVTEPGFGTSERQGGQMWNLRVGFPLNERVSLALEGNVWTRTQGDLQFTLVTNTLGVAVHPVEGLVLRGGIGIGHTTVNETNIFRQTHSWSKDGVGLHFAAGYEFRLARRFAIGPQLDYGLTTFDGGHADWFGGGVNFNWYFVKAR
jgi:hypothetical protein